MLIMLFLCFWGCHKKNLFKGEVRFFEGQLHYNYINSSLGFSVSLFGGMKSVLNPSKKEIANAIGILSVQSEIQYNKLKDKETILLNSDKDKVGIHQLFQAYRIDKKFNLSEFIENYRKSTASESVVCLQDSIKSFLLDDIPFYTFRYSIKYQSKFVNVEEYFCIHKNYLLRFLFLRKDGNDCDNQALEYEAATIISTFKKEQPVAISPNQLFLEKKFNYLESIAQLRQRVDADKELLGTYYSYVGDIKQALHYKPYSSRNQTIKADLTLVAEAMVVDARKLPYLIPDSCNVVMVNEDHLNPYSRFFMSSLLESFKKQGFSILAAETLNAYDTIFAYKQLTQGTGFYVSEPNYGNLLRSAINLEYDIYHYENAVSYDSTSSLNSAAFREFQQAQNLTKIVRQNPQKKIIVFAGHGHIRKNSKGGKMMAQFFQELTGITPFCIEQTIMTEADSIHKEHPIYRFVEQKHSFDKSIILKLKTGLFVEPDLKNSIDVQVFHPRTVFDTNNYALWLLHKGNNKQKFSFKAKQYSNTIFQVFNHQEYSNLAFKAVPMLNLPLNGNNEFELFLPDGVYSVLVFDRYRNILFNKILTFK